MSRFAQLPPRTQKLVVGSALAVLLLAGAGLSWNLHERVAAARARLEASSANRAAMNELVQRFEARARSGAAPDLSALVARSLQGKSFQPGQMQQQNGELALRLDNVAFADVLDWLIELEEQGAVPAQVAISQGQPAGVTVTLVLRGG